MRRRAPLVVLLIALAIVLVVGASIAIPRASVAVHNRVTFGTFDTAGAPPRIDYCGRRYYPDPDRWTLSEIKALLHANGLSGLTRIGTTPSGMPMVTDVISPSTRAKYQTNVCTMMLWVQTGPDSYAVYPLSGGP